MILITSQPIYSLLYYLYQRDKNSYLSLVGLIPGIGIDGGLHRCCLDVVASDQIYVIYLPL